MKRLWVVCFLVFAVLGCGKKEEMTGAMEMDGHEMHNDEGMMGMSMESDSGVVIRKARKDEIGKSVVCPVMGTKFKVKKETEAADYKEKTYYFCCPACPPEFKKNPGKYAK